MKCFEMMVTAPIRKNIGPPMPKHNDNSCLQEDQESYSTCTFLCRVKLMLRISNIFLHLVKPFIKNKVSLFNTSQKELAFYEIFVYKISVQ